MTNLEQCRTALPMPELMAKLGMSEHAKAKAHCPWHEDKSPSFGIFEKEGRWWFKCQAGCGHGDEVDLLQKVLAIATKGEAIKQYANMAGVNGEMTPGKFMREATDIFPGAAVVQNGTPPNLSGGAQPPIRVSGDDGGGAATLAPSAQNNFPVPVLAEPPSSRCKSGNSETSGNDGEARESTSPVDSERATLDDSRAGKNLSGNQSGVEAASVPVGSVRRVTAVGSSSKSTAIAQPPAQSLTPASIMKLAKWRSLSPLFVERLAETRVVVTLNNHIAFPVPGGFHYRLKDGSWRYTEGAKPDLFTLGEIEEGAHVHCFESPWDALAYADTIADSWNNIVATRGASNAKLLADRLKGHTGTLYLWRQNDAPGQKWAEDIRKLLTDAQMKLVNVPNEYKDLNAWRLAGATDNQILGARLDAIDFRVPALAEVREGAENCDHTGEESSMVDSLGAENNLSGGVESRHAAIVGADDLKRELVVPAPEKGWMKSNPDASSGSSAPPAQNSFPVIKGESSGAVAVAAPNHGMNLAQTLGSVVEFLKRYVVFAIEEQALACALWIAHTWVYDAFDYTPILHIHAPDRGCGKSILLETVGLISCRPELFVNTSETALFREINELHPTLLWDEIDNFLIDDRSPILGMLNAGYKRGGKVKRNADFGARRETFDVFCPKALTGIKKIPESISSRSLSIRLTRASKGTGIKFRSKRAEPEALPIIAALQSWAIDAKSILAGEDVELPDELAGRQQDIFEPLLAIADMAGTEWSEQGRDALVTLARALEDSSIGEQLLSSCREIFNDSGDTIATTELLKKLVAIEDADAPWPGWWESELSRGNTHGPGWKLSKILKPYGIHPRTIRLDSDEKCKGYLRKDFEGVWGDYLTKKEPAKEVKDDNMELDLE